MKKTTVSLAALVLAATLGLTGCSGLAESESSTKTVTATESASGDKSKSPSSSSTIADEELTDADASPEDYDESDAQDTIVGFGEEYKWLDGTKVTISEPKPYQPDEFAAGGEDSPEIVSVDVTITNGQDAPLDASFETPTVTSAGTPGDEVYDDTVGMGTEMSVMPGKSVTFKSAYGVEDSEDITAEFAPTWDHRAAYWTTDAK